MTRLFLSLMTALTLLAAGFPAMSAAQPLQPQDAFALTVQPGEDGALDLHWRIADGYYLYRSTFAAETADGRGLPLGLPAGEPYDDPYFGAEEIFRQDVAARVTIVEYFDYQCPFCKRDHAILTDLVARDGDIGLVMRDWPIFGAPSILASQLVLGAASMGSYAQAHAALMAAPARLSEDEVRQVLMDAGIGPTAALAAYRADRDRWDGLLSRNAAQAVTLNLQGAPAFIIGAAIYPGALGEAGLRQAITHARQA